MARVSSGGASRNFQRRLEGLQLPVSAAAFALALWLELWVQRRDAFWLDEAWTGAIVGPHSWAEVFRQVYWDVNAPVYYLIMHLWQGVFGLSDAALRAPSLVCAALTPLVLASPAVGLPRPERLTWAALTALWFPALCYAQEARCYALLLLVSALQTTAFLRLVAEPRLVRAFAWSGLAALAILIHYDALPLAAVQGLVYLASTPRRAARTWPAALAFLPAFGWMLAHLPTLRAFARPELAWYSTLRPRQLWAVADYLAGAPGALWALAFLATSALTLRLAWPGRPPSPAPAGRAWLAAVAAAVAAAILIAAGFLRPSFAFRYLTPSAPGLLLGVVLGARVLAGRWTPLVFLALILAYAWVGAGELLGHHRMAPRLYSFERASAALTRSRPKRLVFLWDHPIDPALHREQLAALGGFFMHRQGLAVAVDPVVLRPGEDPNARLLAEARPQGSAILWLYDKVVSRTAAIRHPPDLTREDAAWACRDYGAGRFGVLACTRPSPARPITRAKMQPRS